MNASVPKKMEHQWPIKRASEAGRPPVPDRSIGAARHDRRHGALDCTQFNPPATGDRANEYPGGVCAFTADIHRFDRALL